MDLDGTLIYRDETIHPVDAEILKALGRSRWIRTIATGRSLESFRRALPDMSRLPVDYLVFSAGAGIVRTSDGALIRTVNLTARAVEEILAVINPLDLDFMIHDAAPDNVKFAWWSRKNALPSPSGNSDFFHRVALYEGFHRRLQEQPHGWDAAAAQIICIIPPGNPSEMIQHLTSRLPRCNVIRTTSPLDGQSTWIEIYPEIVSKGQTCDWLVRRATHPEATTVSTIAIGNDFNDLDLLHWAEKAYVVSDAPAELKEIFAEIPSRRSSPTGILGHCPEINIIP